MVTYQDLTPLVGKKFSLVDDRIVIGESSWIATVQPITVCILHPKQTKNANRELIEQMIKVANLAIDSLAIKRELAPQ